MPSKIKKNKRGILLPPAIGYSLNILLNLALTNKIDLKYIPKLLLVCVINVINFPFRSYERLIINPKLKRKEIENPPIFIIGHWRSGTTHLHNILSKDPQMAYTTTYQSVFPDTMFNHLGRFIFNGFMRLTMPKTREGDNVQLASSFPQEEEFALGDKTPICFYYFWMFPKNILNYYARFIQFKKIDQDKLNSWKQGYKLLIVKSLKNTKNKIYLSKNPPNTARIILLLEMFPNAKFIHIHRNPIEVFLSTQKFFNKMLPHLQFQTITNKEIDAAIITLYKNLMGDYLIQKKQIPVGNLFEISFDQLEDNPTAILQELYQKLNLTGFDQAQPKFRDYLESVNHYKKNKHLIKREQLNTLITEWEFCMNSLNYTVPKTINIIDG